MTFSVARIIALGIVVLGLGMLTENPALGAKASSRFIIHAAPKAVADIKFQDADGKALSLKDYHGKLILLNIRATWCGPCRKEMPTLDRLQEKLGSSEFEVVALSIDRAGSAVGQKFYDEIGIKHLQLVIDTTMRVMRDLRVVGLPMTLLIAPSGKEIARLIVALIDIIAKADGDQIIVKPRRQDQAKAPWSSKPPMTPDNRDSWSLFEHRRRTAQIAWRRRSRTSPCRRQNYSNCDR